MGQTFADIVLCLLFVPVLGEASSFAGGTETEKVGHIPALQVRSDTVTVMS